MAKENDDARLKDIIIQCNLADIGNNRDKSKLGIGIIGFPSDEGTVINGGRGGGKHAPKAFREHLYKIGCIPNPEFGIDISKYVQIFDLGNVEISQIHESKMPENLQTIHENLSKMVETALNHGLIPFVIGGSNDQSYPNGKALINYCSKNKNTENKPIGVINIDAHFDVRDKKNGLWHSGSPFRQLLENKIFIENKSYFTEFACQGHQCSLQHFNYIKNKPNTNVLWLTQDLRKIETEMNISIDKQFDQIMDKMDNDSNNNICSFFISFDIDSIKASDCAGVSCPSPIGLTANEACKICLNSGINDKVMLMDCSEFNPIIESYNTARLVATMFYHFALGVAMRSLKLRKQKL